MYVFLMDRGQLVQINFLDSPESVTGLREKLARDCGLLLNKQVLLVSGGYEVLTQDDLSKFDAGHDPNNPIYVFILSSDTADWIQPKVLKVWDADLSKEIANRLTCKPSLQALKERLGLLKKLIPVASETYKAIKQLLSEQRQMVQGWHVASAHLAEVVSEAKKTVTRNQTKLSEFESCLDEWDKAFDSWTEWKQEMSRVPLLPQLITRIKERQLQTASGDQFLPKNLYQWFCCQWSQTGIKCRWKSTSSVNKFRSGRKRTTSAEQLEWQLSIHHRLVMTPTTDQQQQQQQQSVTMPTVTHPRPPQTALVSDALPSDDQSGSDESYEANFMAYVRDRESDLRFLRFGPDPQVIVHPVPGKLNHTRKQFTRLLDLLHLVPLESIESTTEFDGDNDPHPAAAGHRLHSKKRDVSLSSGIDGSNIDAGKIRALFDQTYFSQQLAQLNPFTEEAAYLLRTIEQVERNLSAVYQSAVASNNASMALDHFESHTQQLRQVLKAFDVLRVRLDETMDSKLRLSQKLQEHQQWLQEFQSELRRLDSQMCSCILSMDHITRFCRLLTQLHSAPLLYIRSLIEVVRRAEFEEAFCIRSNRLMQERHELQSEERSVRQQFAAQTDGHFIRFLISCCTDVRPTQNYGYPSPYSRQWNISDADSLGVTELSTRETTVFTCTQGSPAPNAITRSNCRLQPATSTSSRSEPYLNELLRTQNQFCSSTRPSPRFRQPFRDLGEMAILEDLDVTPENVPERVAMNPFLPTRSRNHSTTDLWDTTSRCVTGKLAQNNSRRSSLVGQATCPSPWTPTCDNQVPFAPDVDPTASVASCDPGRTPQSLAITRDDLQHLATQLSGNLSQVLLSGVDQLRPRLALVRHPQHPASNVEHIGLVPAKSQKASILMTDASVSSSGGGPALTEIGCQTDSFLSTFGVPNWPSQRDSKTSSLLPADDTSSSLRPITWEAPPSSSCSWELCPAMAPIPFPLSEAQLRRCFSTGALTTLYHRVSKSTQTTTDSQNMNKHDGDEDDDDTERENQCQPHLLPQDAAIQVDLTQVTTSPLTVDIPHKSEDVTNGSIKVIQSSPESNLSHHNLTVFTREHVTSSSLADDRNSPPHSIGSSSSRSGSFHSTKSSFGECDDGFEIPKQKLTGAILDIEENTLVDSEGLTVRRAAPCFGSEPFHNANDTRTSVVVRSTLPDEYPSPVSTGAQSPRACQLNQLHLDCLRLVEYLAQGPDDELLTAGDSQQSILSSNTADSSSRKRWLNRLLSQLRLHARSCTQPTLSQSDSASVHVTAYDAMCGRNNLLFVEQHVQTDSTCLANQAEFQDAELQWSSHPSTSSVAIQTLNLNRTPSLDRTLESSIVQDKKFAGCVDDILQQSTLCTTDLQHTPICSTIRPTECLRLGSPTGIGRQLGFIHRNFTPSDTVIFIPVRGWSNYHTGNNAPTTTNTVAPPTIGSKIATTTSNVCPSGLQQGGHHVSSDTSAFRLFPWTIMESFIHPSSSSNAQQRQQQPPSPSLTRSSLSNSRSMLANDLITSMTGPSGSLSVSTFSGVGSRQQTGCLVGGPSNNSGSNANNMSTVQTQWRMLSSDGHVYFLHQDDFMAFGIDPAWDYCTPVITSQNRSLRARHTSRRTSSKESRSSGPPSDNRLPSPLLDKEAAGGGGGGGGGARRDDELIQPRSYFLVAKYQRKECCVVRRHDNRFNLPMDFAFYRVRAQP